MKKSKSVKRPLSEKLKKASQETSDDAKCTLLELEEGYETLRFFKTIYPGLSPSTASLEHFKDYANKTRLEDAVAVSKTILRLAREDKTSDFWKMLIKNAKAMIKNGKNSRNLV